MMPSACTKGENKASLEAPEPLKQALNVVDKKVRNLEKRKGKLDAYKVKYAGGETLNKDQQEAIEKYEGVVSQLEFARELQKQFIAMQGDVEKMMRKFLKKEKIERQAQETRRVKELLQVQNILEYFGEDSVKADFQNASKGAVQLSEEDLNKLELLYKLICPSREGEVSYEEQLNQAAEHIANFLDAKEKEVENTTYKDLKELTDKIIACGYFEHINSPEQEQEQDTESNTEEPPVVEEFPDKPEELTIETEDCAPLEEVQQISPEQEFTEALEQSPPRLAPVSSQVAPPCEEDSEPTEQTNLEDDSFFTTVPFPRHRPFQEIVSSVQGDFNFLQDSEIETDYTSGLPSQSYQTAAAGLLSGDEQASQYASLQQQHTQQQPSPTSGDQSSSTSQKQMPDSSRSAAESKQTTQQQQFGDLPSQTAQSASGMVQQQTALESTYSSEQSYSQNLMSQTLGGATQHTYSELAQQMATPSGIDQVVGITSSAPSDVPQPIPLPSQTLPGQSLTEQTFGASAASQPGYGATEGAASGYGASDSSQTVFGMSDNTQSGFSSTETSVGTAAVGNAQVGADTQEKKEYSMNPEADVFRSMYSHPTSFAQQSSGMSHASMAPAAMAGHDGKTFSQTAMHSEFQSGSNFGGSGNYNHQRNGPPRGGNNRGRGGRGNSFNRGGRGGSYGGGRGNYTNGGRGSRGGGSYQGFSARNDYRPDGYQGFNNNITSGYNNKRVAVSRGGAVRGGNPRGGMRGGGSSRGGSYRPSSGHQHIQQTTQASA